MSISIGIKPILLIMTSVLRPTKPTSQVAESHVEALINARHKRTKKMQWTREGAHHVLQIRAMMASKEWESKCQGAVLSALGAVA
jgi:hypothetical protein